MSNNLSRRDILKLMGTVAIGMLVPPCSVWPGNKQHNNNLDLNIFPIPKETYFREGCPLLAGDAFSAKYTDGLFIKSPIKDLSERLKEKKIKISTTVVPSKNKLYLIINPGSIAPSLQNYEKLYSQILGKSQGYFIDVQSDYLYIGANDANGLSYGIYSLIDLIGRSTVPLKIPLLTIVDYPDFFYRSPTYLYTFQAALIRDERYSDKVKSYLDFLAVKKVNASFWPRVTITGDWKLNEKWHFKDINQHALNMGIKLFVESHFDLNIAWRNEGVKNPRICMGDISRSSYCYGDDMLEKKSKILSDFCKEYRPGGIIFHTIDFDPHWWNGKRGWWEQRCEVCRKKYKDDERWKADRDQIKSFYKAIKEVSPDTEIMVVLWPYHPRMLTGEWNLFPGSEEKYKDYLLKVTSEIPKDIWLATRECTPSQLDVWIKHISGQPIAWWIYPGRRNHWIYTSMAGMATWFREGYKMAMFWNDSGIWLPYELSNMTAQQFMWNAKTEGFQIYKTTQEMYETWRKEEIAYKPGILISNTYPKIAKNIYGDASSYVLKALKTNVERNDPYHPKDTGEPGWRYSRFEYDIDGKLPSPVDKRIHDPQKTFTTIWDEANEIYSAMSEAIKYLPQDYLRRFVILCLYEKSRQLKARGEGFYNWMQASQALKKDDTEIISNYLINAVAYFEIEEFLMLEAEKKGFPPEMTLMFGYVPIYWKPVDKLKQWCVEHKIQFPSRAAIDNVKKRISI